MSHNLGLSDVFSGGGWAGDLGEEAHRGEGVPDTPNVTAGRVDLAPLPREVSAVFLLRRVAVFPPDPVL